MSSDLRQSEEYGRYMELIGWRVEGGCFIKKLPLLPFSFIKIQRPNRIVEFETIAKKYRAVAIKIEPNFLQVDKLLNSGFKPDRSPMLPTKTIWLDLTKSQKQLLAAMHPKTRYNLRKFSIHNFQLAMIPGNKVDGFTLRQFFKIYRQNCRRQHFWGVNFKQLKSLFKAFGKKSYLLVARSAEHEVRAGLVILIHDQTAYYSHNAATPVGKKKFLPTLLAWEAIKLSKKLGCTRFDFEGISDERYPHTKKWAGFSRFKKSFGGKEVKYFGSFSQWRLQPDTSGVYS